MTPISPTALPTRVGTPFLSQRKPGRAYAPLRLFPHDPSAREERVKALMQTARRGLETASLLKTGYRKIPSEPNKPQIKNALANAIQRKDWKKAALFNSARNRATVSWLLSGFQAPDYTEKELEAACFESVQNGNWKFILELADKDLLTNRTLIKMIHAADCKQVKGVKKPLMKHLLPKDADKNAREDVLFESIEVGCPLTAKYALEQGEFSYEALENGVLACCGNKDCGEMELEAILAYILRKAEGFLFTEARANALLSAAERGRTALIHALLGSDPPERAMRCREAVYVAGQQQNTFIGAFFNSAEPQHGILSSLLAWSQKKKGGGEYRSRLLAASMILKCEIERGGELNLSGLGLSSLPNCLHLLEKLERLDVSRNSLAQLPPQFLDCANLRTLNLSRNPLQRLPKNLASLNPDCVIIAPLPIASQIPVGLPNGSRPTILYAAEPAKKRVPAHPAELQPHAKLSRLTDIE